MNRAQPTHESLSITTPVVLSLPTVDPAIESEIQASATRLLNNMVNERVARSYGVSATTCELAGIRGPILGFNGFGPMPRMSPSLDDLTPRGRGSGSVRVYGGTPREPRAAVASCLEGPARAAMPGVSRECGVAEVSTPAIRWGDVCEDGPISGGKLTVPAIVKDRSPATPLVEVKSPNAESEMPAVHRKMRGRQHQGSGAAQCAWESAQRDGDHHAGRRALKEKEALRKQMAFRKRVALRGLSGGSFSKLRGAERREAMEHKARSRRVETCTGGISKKLQRFLLEDEPESPEDKTLVSLVAKFKRTGSLPPTSMRVADLARFDHSKVSKRDLAAMVRLMLLREGIEPNPGPNGKVSRKTLRKFKAANHTPLPPLPLLVRPPLDASAAAAHADGAPRKTRKQRRQLTASAARALPAVQYDEQGNCVWCGSRVEGEYVRIGGVNTLICPICRAHLGGHVVGKVGDHPGVPSDEPLNICAAAATEPARVLTESSESEPESTSGYESCIEAATTSTSVTMPTVPETLSEPELRHAYKCITAHIVGEAQYRRRHNRNALCFPSSSSEADDDLFQADFHNKRAPSEAGQDSLSHDEAARHAAFRVQSTPPPSPEESDSQEPADESKQVALTQKQTPLDGMEVDDEDLVTIMRRVSGHPFLRRSDLEIVYTVVPYTVDTRLVSSRNVVEVKQPIMAYEMTFTEKSNTYPLIAPSVMTGAAMVGLNQLRRLAPPKMTALAALGLLAYPAYKIVKGLLLPLKTYRVSWIPHLVSAVMSEYDRGTNASVAHTTLRRNLRRLQSLPIPDVDLIAFYSGTEEVINQLLTRQSFFTGGAKCFRPPSCRERLERSNGLLKDIESMKSLSRPPQTTRTNLTSLGSDYRCAVEIVRGISGGSKVAGFLATLRLAQIVGIRSLWSAASNND